MNDLTGKNKPSPPIKAGAKLKSKQTTFEKMTQNAMQNIESQLISKQSMDPNTFIKKTLERGTLTDDASDFGRKLNENEDNTLSMAVRVDLIDPNPYQPRMEFNQLKLEELADAIRITGQIQPIALRKHGERYQIIAGERRVRAIKLLGNETIDAVVKEGISDDMMAIMALAENIHREDLSDYEIGISINNIQAQFTSKKLLADYIECSRMDIYRYLAYLSLPKWILCRLDINPRIFNRVNALELKKLIESTGFSEDIYRNPINKAMDLLENGAITQNLFINSIKRAVSEAKNPHAAREKVIEKSYMVDGKVMGKMILNDKHLTIKVKASLLTESDTEIIYKFISDKLAVK